MGGARARPDRGPAHLSRVDGVAVCSARAFGARPVVLRALARLRDLRGRHGSLLGAQPRARVHGRRQGAPADGSHADDRARRDRRRLGLRIRARRPQRRARPRGAAQPAGLERALRAGQRAGRRRGRVDRRLRAPVSGSGRSRAAARLWDPAARRHRGGARVQPGGRRRRDRDRRTRASDSRARLCPHAPGSRARAAAQRRARRSRVPARRGDRGLRTRPAPRAGGARRRGRGGRRHRRHALWRERARGDRCGEGTPRVGARESARGRGDRHDLRPLGTDPRRHRDAPRHVARGDARRFRRDLRVPVARAQRADPDPDHSDRNRTRVRAHALSGPEREHHVARWNRGGDRRDGRRGDHRRRERTQATRGLGARGPTRRARGRDPARDAGGRTEHLLRAARDHRLVPADLRARGHRRAPLQAARVHEDLRDGLRGGALGHADTRARGALDSREDSRRARQSDQSLARARLHTGRAARRAAPSRRRDRGTASARNRDTGISLARLGVHAAAERGNAPLHADGPAGDLHRRGIPHPPAHGPRAQGGARSRAGVRQDRPRRDADGSGSALDGRDDRAARPARALASGTHLGVTRRGARSEAPLPRHAEPVVDADPDTHGDARDGRSQPARREGLRRRGRASRAGGDRDRGGASGRARHAKRVRGARHRRVLPGRARRSRARRTLRRLGGRHQRGA